MTRVTQVDNSGAQTLAMILANARAIGMRRVAVTAASTDVRIALLRCGVFRGQRDIDTLQAAGSIPAAELFQTLEEALEFYEEELLAESCVDKQRRSGAMPLDPEKLTQEQWRIIRGASSETLGLADGEVLCSFGDPVDGLWLLVEGRMRIETMGAEKEDRVAKTAAKYTAPFAIGSTTFFLQAHTHAFRLSAHGAGGAKVLWLRDADLRRVETEHPGVYLAFVTCFVGYSLAVENLHIRWRSVL